MTTRNSINKYLTHNVDIIKVTMIKGVRSTSTVTNQPAFISNGEKVVVDRLGSHLIKYTKIYMKPDTDINLGDELLFDGRTRPIKNILKSRNLAGIHHLEVEVG